MAINVLRPSLRSPAALNLLSEARTMARLSHPDVVTVYQADVFEDESLDEAPDEDPHNARGRGRRPEKCLPSVRGSPAAAHGMKVRLESCILHRAHAHGPTFVAVRAQHVEAATVGCRRERRRPASCVGCPHLLDHTADGVLRCVFLDDDGVESLMTPVQHIVTVDIDALGTRPRRRKPRQLLVTEGGEAVALVATNGASRSRLRPIPIVGRTTPLSAAVAIIREQQHVVIVVDGDDVVGILTRGDLQRAGVPRLTA